MSLLRHGAPRLSLFARCCTHCLGSKYPAQSTGPKCNRGVIAFPLAVLFAAGMLDRTLVLVMSDHGREARAGKAHGGFTTAEMGVQWLVFGAGVKRGRKISQV